MARSSDETGEMLTSLKTLVDNLQNLRIFTTEVGEGKFDNRVAVFNNKGEIAQSLIVMRDSLKTSATKEYQDKWIADGLNGIAKVVQQGYKDTTSLYDEILKFFVRYLKVNQGSFFVKSLNEENALELASCYA